MISSITKMLATSASGGLLEGNMTELSIQRFLRAMTDANQIRIFAIAGPMQTQLGVPSPRALLLLFFTPVLLGKLAGPFRLCSSCWSDLSMGIFSLLDEYLWAETASPAVAVTLPAAEASVNRPLQ